MVALHQASSRSANSRWRGSKKGQSSQSVTMELRFALVGKGFIGAAEVVGLHAFGLGLGLHVERGLDRHRPFGVELLLGHIMGLYRAVSQAACQLQRLFLHIIDDAAEEAPALSLLGTH